jgi:hypothetical protein
MTMIVPSADTLETTCCMSGMMIWMQRSARLAVNEIACCMSGVMVWFLQNQHVSIARLAA